MNFYEALKEASREYDDVASKAELQEKVIATLAKDLKELQLKYDDVLTKLDATTKANQILNEQFNKLTNNIAQLLM